MLSVKDFIEKYELYSDEELIEVDSNINNYSEEANEALNIVLQKKGGIEVIQKRLADKAIITNEIERIKKETIRLSSKETNADFIKSLISSDLLPKEKIHEIINEQFGKFEAHVKDITVDSKTVAKAVFATVIASIVGGIYIWFVLSNASRIPILFFIGLGLLCYGIIRLITKKTKANTIVFIASFLSFTFSLLIGYGLTSFFGQPW